MKNRGFTLIEIMTAVSVFAVVMTISVGSIIGVFDTNRKSEALKTVMDNLNIAIESMSREMRFGTYYDCSPSLPVSLPPPVSDCQSGANSIAFRSSNGTRVIVYRLTGTSIEKSTDGGLNFIEVTAPEIKISSLKFFVIGSSTKALGDFNQPKVLAQINGSAGTGNIKASAQTSFTVQTLVSQRQLDNQ